MASAQVPQTAFQLSQISKTVIPLNSGLTQLQGAPHRPKQPAACMGLLASAMPFIQTSGEQDLQVRRARAFLSVRMALVFLSMAILTCLRYWSMMLQFLDGTISPSCTPTANRGSI